MADHTVIRHQLDLVLHLVDTTTGSLLTGVGARFFCGGKPLHFLSKGDGHLLLMGRGREDFRLTVELRGYLPRTIDVRYEELSEKMPLIELPMIPDGSAPALVQYVDLEGKLEGLSALDAVWLGDRSCMIRDFNAKKKSLTVFNPYRLLLDRVFYALVNPQEQVYEPLEIEERISDTQFLLKQGLSMEYGSNFPIARRVFGLVREDGSYLLRLADRGGDSRWLVRCVMGEKEWFQAVDAKVPQESPLSPPQEEPDSEPQEEPAGKGGM